MDVKLEKWHKCQVDKEILKQLSKKSDIKGLQHVSVFFGLLLATGILAYQTWGTWWSVFWFLVYGNIYSFSNPLWHETGHKTAFQSKFLNELFYISLHTWLILSQQDGDTHTLFIMEILIQQKIHLIMKLNMEMIKSKHQRRLIINLVPFLDLVFFKKHISFEIVQHALGIKTKVMQDSIPENAQSKAILISRVYVVIWLSIILWSILVSSWMPLLYFVLPQFYGKTLHKLVAFTQHAGLARNIKDHRVTSREMYLNPILSFLYWKMEYHLTHHMFPTVPSYNLDKLHDHLKDQLPKPNDGLIDAYKEIIPALMKQKEDTSYFIKKELPEPENI